MKKLIVFSVSVVMLLGMGNVTYAKNDKQSNLPPGLEMNVNRGINFARLFSDRQTREEMASRSAAGKDKAAHVMSAPYIARSAECVVWMLC